MAVPVYPVHPAADIFPMLGADELRALGEDMAKNGQRFPIALWKGVLVDGRNRLAACRLLHFNPTVEEVDFETDADCIRFIISLNLNRRHLSDEQRDQIGAKLVNMQAGGIGGASTQNARTPGIGIEAAAVLVHSTPARINRARTIERADPALAERVISGEISKGKALKEIRERTRVKPVTDPNQAADSVIDASEKRAAEGDTARGHAVVAAMARLDPTELTFHRPAFLRILGVEQ